MIELDGNLFVCLLLYDYYCLPNSIREQEDNNFESLIYLIRTRMIYKLRVGNLNFLMPLLVVVG